MEAAYKNLSLFFVVILVFVVWGFFRTYFGLFPTFAGLTTVHHFHGILMLGWFAMLIIQPILIRYKKFEWHQNLGKLSYFLIPLILLSIFLVTKLEYIRNATTMSKEINIGSLALNVPDIFAFAAFYILAMINVKNPSVHMRYMIATSLLLLGPGTGRAFIIYGGMAFPQGIEYSFILTDIIAIALIVYDKKKGNSLKPYLVMLAVLIAMHVAWDFQLSWWWQAFAGKFADLFF